MKINYPFIKKGGFTLIELMVVIAIIGILTAIVTANFAQSKAKARDAKRVSDLAQIQLTLEMVFDRCNKYPIDIISTSNTICSNYTLDYFISKMPDDNGVPYDYMTNGTQTTDATDYVLGAKLETNSTALSDTISAYPGNIPSVSSPAAFPSGNDCTHPAADGSYYYCVVPK